jgi:hypothetical protein
VVCARAAPAPQRDRPLPNERAALAATALGGRLRGVLLAQAKKLLWRAKECKSRADMAFAALGERRGAAPRQLARGPCVTNSSRRLRVSLLDQAKMLLSRAKGCLKRETRRIFPYLACSEASISACLRATLAEASRERRWAEASAERAGAVLHGLTD